jgi:hypothetical protein
MYICIYVYINIGDVDQVTNFLFIEPRGGGDGRGHRKYV